MARAAANVTGGTPSSRAMLTTAIKYPKSLIIHFSDGAGNMDISLLDVFRIMETKFPKIQVVSLLLNESRYIQQSKDQLPYGWQDVIERFLR